MTAEDMESLAAQGQFWWMRGDGTFYGTVEYEPADTSDVYLLDANQSWVDQWEGDWSKAVEYLEPLLSKLSEHEGNAP